MNSTAIDPNTTQDEDEEECTRIVLYADGKQFEITCAGEVRDIVQALEAEHPGATLAISLGLPEPRLSMTIEVRE